jgi:hypothetical protein
LLSFPGELRAFSRFSRAPFCFLIFLTSWLTAFSDHFSSSSPCFHPSNRFTAGELKENREVRLEMGDDDILEHPIKSQYLKGSVSINQSMVSIWTGGVSVSANQ